VVIASVLVALLLQAAPDAKAVEADNQKFLALETRVSGAIQIKNAAALDELLAKDFAFSLFLEGRAPEVMSRGEWLKASAIYSLTAFELRHLSARVFGDVAVVRLQPSRTAKVGTTLDRSGEFAVVDVWTKEGEAWKLSSRYLARPDALAR
jgi:uncharacterized protein DUF4440